MTETVELKCERLKWEVRKYHQACVIGCVLAVDIACAGYNSSHKTAFICSLTSFPLAKL